MEYRIGLDDLVQYAFEGALNKQPMEEMLEDINYLLGQL